MLHQLLLVAEIRQTSIDDNGWAQYEATGRVCIICPCGLNTGFTDKPAAAQQYREHAPAGTPIRHHPETREARDVLHSMLGELIPEP